MTYGSGLDYLPTASPLQQAAAIAFLLTYTSVVGYALYQLFTQLNICRKQMVNNQKINKLNSLLNLIMLVSFINVWYHSGMYLIDEAKLVNATLPEFLLNERWFLHIWNNAVSTVQQRLWTSQLWAFLPMWGLFCYVESSRTSFPVFAGFISTLFNGPALVAPLLISAVRSTPLSRYYSRFSIPANKLMLTGFMFIGVGWAALPLYHSGTPFTYLLWYVHICFAIPVFYQWLTGQLGEASAILYKPGGKPSDTQPLPSLAEATKNVHTLLWIQWSYMFFAAMYLMNYFISVFHVLQASTGFKDFVFLYWDGAFKTHSQITATSDLVVAYLVLFFIFMPTSRQLKTGEFIKYLLAAFVVTPPVAWAVFMCIRESRIISTYLDLVRENEEAKSANDAVALAAVEMKLKSKMSAGGR